MRCSEATDSVSGTHAHDRPGTCPATWPRLEGIIRRASTGELLGAVLTNRP
jgi:hypothetical protein